MHTPDSSNRKADRHDKLLRVAASLLGSREAAEDVVQEALLRHVERADEPPQVPDAWLVKVTRNLAVDRLRRQRLERETLPFALDAGFHGGEAGPSPEDELEHRERCREAIRRMLAGSASRDVAATLLREVFGTDYEDIARRGGRSRDGCRQAVHRALRRARKKVEEEDAARREAETVDRTRADAVLDRFASAVLEGDPAPLFDAIRAEPCIATAGTASACGPYGRGDTLWLHVETDAAGFRMSLRLGSVTLCTLTDVTSGRVGASAYSGSPISTA